MQVKRGAPNGIRTRATGLKDRPTRSTAASQVYRRGRARRRSRSTGRPALPFVPRTAPRPTSLAPPFSHSHSRCADRAQTCRRAAAESSPGEPARGRGGGAGIEVGSAGMGGHRSTRRGCLRYRGQCPRCRVAARSAGSARYDGHDDLCVCAGMLPVTDILPAWRAYPDPGPLRPAARCGRSANAGSSGPAGDAGGRCRCRLERERRHRDHLGGVRRLPPAQPFWSSGARHAAGGRHSRAGPDVVLLVHVGLFKRNTAAAGPAPRPIVEKLQEATSMICLARAVT